MHTLFTGAWTNNLSVCLQMPGFNLARICSVPSKTRFTLAGPFPRHSSLLGDHRSPSLGPPASVGPVLTGYSWRSRSRQLAGLQPSEKRDSCSLCTKKGKVCVASGFPEKCSHRMAQLCGLAPDAVLGGCPLVATTHLS